MNTLIIYYDIKLDVPDFKIQIPIYRFDKNKVISDRER